MVTTAHIPIIGIAAYSGTGKTTLLSKLLPLLKAKGLRVGMVKHAHHQFEIDKPGKDSYVLREAGAEQMLVASRQRWVLMAETGDFDDPYLDQVLPHLDQKNLDLIIVEGFKHEKFPKIELHRPSLGKPLLHTEDDSVIAVASDMPEAIKTDLPKLDMNQPAELAAFIWKNILKNKTVF